MSRRVAAQPGSRGPRPADPAPKSRIALSPFAEKIAQERGLVIPDETKGSSAAVSAWIASNLGTERRKGRRKTANASKPPGSTPPRSTAPKIAKSDALSHIFGYTCFNDGSIRDIQFKHSIAAGKNFHATGGFGPWILTADEVPDPTRLRLATRLNGKEVQHTGIDDLIFDIPTLISYCSDWTPLIAGDVISTGTPEGVGFARKPPLWMKPGDVVEVEIDGGIGVLRNPIIAES